MTHDWPRYAQALDLRLAGAKLDDIAAALGVSRERARQLVAHAKAQLAFRVFHGLARPHRDRHQEQPQHDWLLLNTMGEDMHSPSEQYDRARQLLLSAWPHTWPQDDDTLMIVAEIMVAFARMEIRRHDKFRQPA